MQLLKHIESTYHHYFLDLLLLFCFLSILFNPYMNHLYLDLFYEAYNTMHQRYQKQGRFFSSLFLNFLYSSKRDLKSSLMILTVS